MKKLINTANLALFLVLIFFYQSFALADENNQLNKEQLLLAAESYVMLAVEHRMQGNIHVEAVDIDSRIDIPECTDGISFRASDESLNQSQVSVKATCNAPDWYMFLMVKVTNMQPVVVVTTALSPGTILNNSNIRVIEMDRKLLRRTTFASVEDVLGARVKRRVRPGRPIDPNNLCFVCKGDMVTIQADSKGMQVKASGIALQDGNLGDTITVKNGRSNKHIDASVISTDAVSVKI